MKRKDKWRQKRYIATIGGCVTSMSELKLRGAMILVGGCIVLAGIVIAAFIMGYSVPFGGILLVICAALILFGVYMMNRSVAATSAGHE